MVTFRVQSPAVTASAQSEIVGATPPPSSAAVTATAHGLVVVLAFASVLVFWWLLATIVHDDGFSKRIAGSTPAEGLTIFAVFFVAAQGIERLMEPLTHLVPRPDPAKETEASEEAEAAVAKARAAYARVAQSTAEDQRNTASVHLENANGHARTALTDAARAKAESKIRKSDLSVGTWAAATIIGMAASASLKLYLLRVVGIAEPSRALEILATGLIIGAGTKPLHELVKLIEKKKEAAENGANAT